MRPTTVPEEANAISVDTPPRTVADRLARKLLLIEGADPKALMSLKGSLLLSAIRCVITYAILPAAAPVFGLSDAVGAPIGIIVSVAAIALSLHSLRRVWLADWTYRWSYTAFIGVVVGLLSWLLVIDVRALLG